MGYLTFGADGTMYLQKYQDAPLISAKNVYRFTQNNFPGKEIGLDFIFWSKHLTYNVIFEEGLTIKKFFECLMPWNNFFSLQTQVHLNDYWDEMKKPVDEMNENYNCIDYVMLYRNISFHPNRQEDFNRRTMQSQRGKISKNPLEYEFDTNYFLSGFKIGEEFPLDFSYLQMQYIADTKLVLQHNSTMQFGDWLKKDNSVVPNTLIMNEDMYGFRKTVDNTPFIEGQLSDISLEELLRSFFRYIFSTIHKRDHGKTIKIEMEQAEKGAEILKFPPKFKQSTETNNNIGKSDMDNVIEVPFKKISREKHFFQQIESSLINRLIENREMEEMLIEYEIRMNPQHRLFNPTLLIGVPPEPRKSNIGIVDENN